MGANPQANILELDKNGDTPLHVYIGETRKYRVELLITLLSSVRQVNVNAKNISGFTPLHIAAMVTCDTYIHKYTETSLSMKIAKFF